MDKDAPEALILAVPIPDGRLAWETSQSIRYNTSPSGLAVLTIHHERTNLVDARNWLANLALITKRTSKLEAARWFVLWVDDCSWWANGSVERLREALLHRASNDVIAGWSGDCREWADSSAMHSRGEPIQIPGDGEFGQVIQCASIGFQFTMHRLSLLELLGPRPFDLARSTSTETESFCQRVHDVGGRVFVHTGCPVAHVDPSTGLAYLPKMPTMRVIGNGLIYAFSEIR